MNVNPFYLARVKVPGICAPLQIPCDNVTENRVAEAGAGSAWVCRIVGVPAQFIQFLRLMGANLDDLQVAVGGTNFKSYYTGDSARGYCNLIEYAARDTALICRSDDATKTTLAWRRRRDLLECPVCGFGMFPITHAFRREVCYDTQVTPKYCPDCGARLGAASQ